MAVPAVAKAAHTLWSLLPEEKKRWLLAFAGLSLLLLVVLVYTLVGALLASFEAERDVDVPSIGTGVLSPDVMRYETLVRRYAEAEGIGEYVPVLLAKMQVETRGLGNDPMQSSESGFNTRYPNVPNAIQDPEYSVEVGVKAFKQTLEMSGRDLPLAVQSYNFGPGYIAYAKDAGGHSETVAKAFSLKMANQLGWTCDDWRAPYCYGDHTYQKKVFDYLTVAPDGTVSLGGSSLAIGDLHTPLVESLFRGRMTCGIGCYAGHPGYDWGVPIGTQVYSMTGGIVVKVVDGRANNAPTGRPDYGNHIQVRYGDVQVTYAHLSPGTLRVRQGDTVKPGQPIALSGNSGNSTGPHLHVDMLKGPSFAYTIDNAVRFFDEMTASKQIAQNH
ncbi:conserved hypothetical protein [Exiguobacterium sp. 8A]|uniref:lysozyme family protein n=1 Tax=Exiguobacterium sp. 8A TaxID=2653139 RepID=UPI0012F21DF5|nr:lysozyme family protein [Exiguobacterium sp. 8A]VXB98221.1 conserved hypothetical protein [Exiguobacterium sp. 8A]